MDLVFRDRASKRPQIVLSCQQARPSVADDPDQPPLPETLPASVVKSRTKRVRIQIDVMEAENSGLEFDVLIEDFQRNVPAPLRGPELRFSVWKSDSPDDGAPGTFSQEKMNPVKAEQAPRQMPIRARLALESERMHLKKRAGLQRIGQFEKGRVTLNLPERNLNARVKRVQISGSKGFSEEKKTHEHKGKSDLGRIVFFPEI